MDPPATTTTANKNSNNANDATNQSPPIATYKSILGQWTSTQQSSSVTTKPNKTYFSFCKKNLATITILLHTKYHLYIYNICTYMSDPSNKELTIVRIT